MTDSDEVKLLPCPDPWCEDQSPRWTRRASGRCRASCGCGIEAPWADTPEGAIAAWNTRDQSQSARIAEYRDIFAEITAKARPECADQSDPERITNYSIPVGPIHRAAGKLGFQMFDGEAHLRNAVARIAELEGENAKLTALARSRLKVVNAVKDENERLRISLTKDSTSVTKEAAK